MSESFDLEESASQARTPRDLALLLLAIGGGPPRQRARAQQADVAGLELYRRVLDTVAALDPDPDDFEEALAGVVLEFGDPTGPTRGVCLGLLHEWQECRETPGAWDWLIQEALTADEDQGPRRKKRGPEIVP